jgi:hypothetical protein
MSRVKITYNNHVYSLGGFPDTYDELLRRVKESIGALSHYATLNLTYKDLDGEMLHLTTTYALKEMYRHLQGSTLRLSVKPGRNITKKKRNEADKENVYNFRASMMALRAIFKICGWELWSTGAPLSCQVA